MGWRTTGTTGGTLPTAPTPVGAQLYLQKVAVSLANLAPYTPSGWSAPIVVSTTTGTNTDSSPLYTTSNLYVDWAVTNSGAAAASSTFYTYLYVDGTLKQSWSTASLAAGSPVTVLDYSLGTLSAGTHTLQITTDATGVITESNESDNSYTKTITVTTLSQPNLTPYTPSGWSAPIVVSTTTGTNTDSSPLYTTSNLYVDWAVANSGAAAASSTFYTYLYVDGTLKQSWSTASLAAGSPVTVLDYSLGTLSAGTHTLQIATDATGVITESNESDNSYTKTITVTTPVDTTPPTPNPSTWATVPHATGTASISMTATAASDPSGVQYFFHNVTVTGHDSGWQASATYQDTGLSANTTYTYQVMTRDQSANLNQGSYSSSASATTQQLADTTPPTPNPSTWATVPHATGTASISMTATAASDPSGVQYFFHNVTVAGHDSGWQASATFTDTGLTPNTMYTYEVMTRDQSSNLNQGNYSASASATTQKSAPTFNNLSASTSIIYGTSNVILSGAIAAGASPVPNGETITVTINGVAQTTTTTGGNGSFSLSYPTSNIPVLGSAYKITYSYARDSNFSSTSDTSKTLTVTKANQTISWAVPPSIATGRALGTTQLNATVAGVAGGSAPGALAYNPPAGTVFASAGTQTLTVTAAATSDYSQATHSVMLTVVQAVQGYVDGANSSVVSGWAWSAAAGAAAVNVRVDIDGVAGTPFAANLTRTDLQGVLGSTGHGFSMVMPNLPAGTHTIKVYEVPASGAAVLLGTDIISGTRASPPAGYIDAASVSSVSGWAFDPNGGANAISVQVDVDGVRMASGTASNTRNDLTAVVGSPNHGFTLSWTGTGPGTHTVTVYAVDYAYNISVLLGSAVVTNRAPTGWVDTANRQTVSGWAFDADAGATPIQVRVDIDGVPGTPFLASNVRNDLTGYAPVGSPDHGFSLPVPTTLSSGQHTVVVMAQDYPGGGFVQIGTTQIIPALVGSTHAPIGWVDVANRQTVSGWAFDADAGATPIQVRVDIDGVPGTPVLAGDVRNDLTGYKPVGSPDHGFSFPMPTLSSGQHTVAVYAQDYPGSNFVQIGSTQIIPANRAPFGWIDVANRQTISGWAFDPDAGAMSISVRIDVDGVLGTPILAGNPRGDLTGYKPVGSPNHGFSYSLSGLPSGPHTIVVWMLDYAGSGWVQLGTRNV